MKSTIFKCKLMSLLKRAIKKTTAKELNELLKKIILYMTLGIDVSPLFADMCLLSQYPNDLSKKMIYLYLTNYAELNPSLALLAINTFIKECNNPDPKIRGLAVRSLCGLKSQLSSSEIKTQVVRMLEDKNPYVQKCAIYGCLKIHYASPNFIDEYKLLDALYNMLKSPHPIVVSAVINALNEVLEEEGGMAVNTKIINYLLNRLKEFGDYGASQIIELLLKHTPKDEKEMITIMNVLDSKLKSNNSHLTLIVIKVFLRITKENPVLYESVLERIKDNLITMLISSTDELRYNILVQIHGLIKLGAHKHFQKDYKRFFCEADDKSYVQEIRLKILEAVVTHDSFDDIFNELWSDNQSIHQRSLLLACPRKCPCHRKLGQKVP